ncbi:ATP-binding protein [Lutibacter sp.]|uniref:PAS domain-containing sensor histidine kinase n=1 Tax=Lutibacter sp. TaxID=1925666 RepID=UPI003565DE63
MFYKDKYIFNILFEAIPEGVLIIDKNQTIVAANHPAEKMFGYKKGELTNNHFNCLIPKQMRDSHISFFENFKNSNTTKRINQELNLIALSKCNKKFPIEIGLNPFTYENKKYVIALIIDISLRRQNEKRDHFLKLELEKKITQKTADLHNTITQLKELNQNFKKEIKKRITAENNLKIALKKEKELNNLKSKFLTMVSHEFKTPLSGILTSSMLLNKYHLTKEQNKRDKHIKTITNKAQYLDTILNDFLSIEQLEANNINYKFTNFNLSTVINEVIYNANMLLKEGQHIQFPSNIDEFKITQDEKYLKLALTNVLNNAIKYSPENSNIQLLISQTNSNFEFKIIDHGIGIPEQDKKFIFNRYFRAENALNVPGTGIGLNIVKDHIENLGGTINFISNVNKGSTFILTIPNKTEHENHTIN